MQQTTKEEIGTNKHGEEEKDAVRNERAKVILRSRETTLEEHVNIT
jgi:hypothetical protein